MKVKELIEKLKGLDEEMEVGGSGHFGELLEIYGVCKYDVYDYVTLDMESAGDDPDEY